MPDDRVKQIMLRDYLVPGNKHPYEKLPGHMQMAYWAGKLVRVIDVPGFLMYTSTQLDAKEEYPWYSYTANLYYKTAYDMVLTRDGKTLEEVYPEEEVKNG